MTRQEGTSGHWSRFLRDPIILATVAVHLPLAFFTLVPALGPYATSLVLESYALVPISILAILAPWVGMPTPEGRRERIFWVLWSLSMAFHLAVRIVYLTVPDVDYIISGSLVVDTLYVLFYLPLILTVLVRPDMPEAVRDGTGTGARILEVTGTAVFVLALLTYFALVPRFFNRPEYETWVPSLLMYWVLDAFLLLSYLYLRETALTREWRILYTWLLLAPSCWVVTEMAELTFYYNWETATWDTGPGDVLWYIPWIAIIVAARVRRDPAPELFAVGHGDPDRARLRRSLARPGWLLLAGLVFPLVHMGSNLLGILDPGTRNIREIVVLVALILLLGLAALHQKILEGKTLELTRRSRALEERQRLLAAAVEQSPDAILIADRDGVVEYGNHRFADLTGGLGGVLGAHLQRALPPGLEGNAGDSALHELAECLSQGRPWEGRCHPGAHGEEREELVSVSPVKDPRGKVVQWILVRRDVTYLRQLERRFRQAQRMETVGTIAGGIAKDFSDLLGEIYGRGDFLQDQLPEGSPAQDEIRSLLSATEKAAELVNRVRVFGEADASRKLVSLSVLARETLALLRPTLPSNIRLLERIQDAGCAVRGVPHQLQQVVFNLATNAIQAMESGGGTLEVSVEPLEVEAQEALALRLPEAGPYVRLTVRDTGRGMSPETLERIFDPYFTTKGMGAGTGLGLYLVRETVAQHGGSVRAESEVGWGTLFQVFLPCPQGVAPEDAGSRGEGASP